MGLFCVNIQGIAFHYVWFCLQYFLRKQVLSLYREIMRALKEVPDKGHKTELMEWTRTEFKKNKLEKDEVGFNTDFCAGMFAFFLK